MNTQTPQSAPLVAAKEVKKKKLVVLLPEDIIDKLKETSQKTGLPVSLLVAIALVNVADTLTALPRYKRPRGKKKT